MKGLFFEAWRRIQCLDGVVDNENVKIEKKGFFGESDETSGCEIV